MKTVLTMLVTILALAAIGCGPSHKLPESKPLPAGTNFAGVWYSPQFEHMYLRQTGDQVNGIYTYNDGGTIEGTTNGNLITFTWLDPGNKEEARRRFVGKGYLQLLKDGETVKLKGEWGYNDSYHGGGPWEAEWVRDMDKDDPLSLEEWQEKQ